MNNQAMCKMGFEKMSKYIWINGHFTYHMNQRLLEYYKDKDNQLSISTGSQKEIRNIMNVIK